MCTSKGVFLSVVIYEAIFVEVVLFWTSLNSNQKFIIGLSSTPIKGTRLLERPSNIMHSVSQYLSDSVNAQCIVIVKATLKTFKMV